MKKTARRAAKKPVKKKVRRSHLWIVYLCIGFFAAAVGSFAYQATHRSSTCANAISCINDLSGNYEAENEGIYNGKTVSIPKYIAQNIEKRAVLGDSANAQKHIYVDLTYQRIYAFEGSTVVYNFPISSGKWHNTPTGDFMIWIKLRYTRMSGGNPAAGTYYDLPNVPYTMFFYNDKIPKSDGYSIHGAYWHNNFGHPMSHGCINMKEEDVAKIFEWATPVSTGSSTYATADNPGTKVTIYGDPLPELY